MAFEYVNKPTSVYIRNVTCLVVEENIWEIIALSLWIKIALRPKDRGRNTSLGKFIMHFSEMKMLETEEKVEVDWMHMESFIRVSLCDYFIGTNML